MNRVDRMMAIALRLQSRRVIRAEDLAEDFEISVRTVYRGMVALGEAGIPIVSEAGVGYSLVKGYHLPPVMFTAEEASALSIGGKLVETLTDASLRKQMGSALLKIRSVLPRDRQDYLDRLERSIAIVSPNSASAPRLSSETLTPIQRAIAERRVLALDYQASTPLNLTSRQVEALGLIYYGDNWHLIGYCRLRRDVRDFRTDRILKLQLQSEVFSGHTDFSLKRYLESDRYKGKFEMARIRFDPRVTERVRRERSWGLVEAKSDCEGTEVTLLDNSLEWLARWVLSFGSLAQVIAPERLRGMVADEAQKVAARYACRNPSTASAGLSLSTALVESH